MNRRILIILLVMAVAGAGFWLGGLLRGMTEKPEFVPHQLTTQLSAGAEFPDVPLIGEDGARHGSHELLGPEGGVVLFLLIGCGPCKTMSAEWQKHFEAGDIRGFRFYAVAEAPPDLVRIYKSSNNLTFPIYSDTAKVFRGRYGVEDYPLRINVSRARTVLHATWDPAEPVDLDSLRAELGR